MLLALELEELELVLLLKQKQQSKLEREIQEDLEKIKKFIPQAKVPAESGGLIKHKMYTTHRHACIIVTQVWMSWKL